MTWKVVNAHNQRKNLGNLYFFWALFHLNCWQFSERSSRLSANCSLRAAIVVSIASFLTWRSQRSPNSKPRGSVFLFVTHFGMSSHCLNVVKFCETVPLILELTPSCPTLRPLCRITSVIVGYTCCSTWKASSRWGIFVWCAVLKQNDI